jgi:cytochrome c oxidase subunit 2
MQPKIHLLPEQASSLAGQVDSLYLWLVGISVFFSLLIAALILVFAVRYRRRAPREVGSRFDSSLLLEVTWSVIPLLIVLGTFFWGAKLYFGMFRPPADAVEYFVTGKQWMWKIQHPTGQREINQLHVPIGVPIKLTMTSEDVIHSFFVPAFRVKADVLPGRYTTLWFKATEKGTYHLFCTEYCGAEHSKMIGQVVVMDREEYQAWLAGGATGVSMAAAGEQLFTQLACSTCHKADATGRGPVLVGVFGSQVRLANGSTLIADENYLRESILNPMAKVVYGYQPVMPTYQGQLSEEGLLQLISYLKTQKVPPSAPEPPAAGAPTAAGKGAAR